jgi:hypothetical protein
MKEVRCGGWHVLPGALAETGSTDCPGFFSRSVTTDHSRWSDLGLEMPNVSESNRRESKDTSCAKDTTSFTPSVSGVRGVRPARSEAGVRFPGTLCAGLNEISSVEWHDR